MHAAMNGHKDTVQLLADLGADVTKAGNTGWTGGRGTPVYSDGHRARRGRV